MKRNLFKYMVVALGGLFLWACSPDDYIYHDNDSVDISRIGKVVLKPNHTLLLADGQAQLDFRPVVYTKEGYEIPDERVKEEWLEYSSVLSLPLKRHFSVSDASLTGKEISIKVKIKGTEVESETVKFQVVAPLDKKYTSEIRIPIVFHVLQTTEDIEKFGEVYTADRIHMILNKLNNVFEGKVSVNPVGVNTHIRFEYAQYDPDGKKMMNPGINYQTSDAIDIAGNYYDFLKQKHVLWPSDRYMNVWLISDRTQDISDFGAMISDDCQPQYVYAGTDLDEAPKGIDWTEYAEDSELPLNELGVRYKLQELDVMDRAFGDSGPTVNELIYYIGRYLGLLPTFNYGTIVGNDYCADTHDYTPDPFATGGNKSWYKEVNSCYFRAENIMDDPKGVHCSVSKNQCERIRWILENCPGREAWKSDFAFTGK